MALSVNKTPFVSSGEQWDEKYDILVMLWRGMTLSELRTVMEKSYGFRATENQYKRKFNEWYSKGMLPRKKRRKIVQQAMTGEDERDLELESEPGVASTRALGYTVRAVAEDSIGDTGDLRGLFGEGAF